MVTEKMKELYRTRENTLEETMAGEGREEPKRTPSKPIETDRRNHETSLGVRVTIHDTGYDRRPGYYF